MGGGYPVEHGGGILSQKTSSKTRFLKSIPLQIRQLVRYISHDKGYVDGFVRELTSAKRLQKPFVRDKIRSGPVHAAHPDPTGVPRSYEIDPLPRTTVGP